MKSAKANFVVVIKEYRHFDQTKCVEKSPKAKQYYRLLSPHTVIQSVAKNDRIESTVISSVVERSPSLWYEQWRKRWYSFLTTTKFAIADFISPSYGRFHPHSGFHPSRTDFIA